MSWDITPILPCFTCSFAFALRTRTYPVHFHSISSSYVRCSLHPTLWYGADCAAKKTWNRCIACAARCRLCTTLTGAWTKFATSLLAVLRLTSAVISQCRLSPMMSACCVARLFALRQWSLSVCSTKTMRSTAASWWVFYSLTSYLNVQKPPPSTSLLALSSSLIFAAPLHIRFWNVVLYIMTQIGRQTTGLEAALCPCGFIQLPWATTENMLLLQVILCRVRATYVQIAQAFFSGG